MAINIGTGISIGGGVSIGESGGAGLAIVTANLQLYLDAADSASYPGTGTTWTDLSPNAYSTTIVGAPTFSTTYFNFPNTTARFFYIFNT